MCSVQRMKIVVSGIAIAIMKQNPQNPINFQRMGMEWKLKQIKASVLYFLFYTSQYLLANSAKHAYYPSIFAVHSLQPHTELGEGRSHLFDIYFWNSAMSLIRDKSILCTQSNHRHWDPLTA